MIEYDDETGHRGANDNDSTPMGLARWLEEQYTGDDRFDVIDIAQPGEMTGESVRVCFVAATPNSPSDDGQACYFFASIFEYDLFVRVGVAVGNPEVRRAIRQLEAENDGSLTAYLEGVMDVEEALEYEVQHLREDMDYYFSDLPYDHADDLAGDEFMDEIIFYLDGYLTGFFECIEHES